MPSLRVLPVVLLAGLGAVVGAVAGGGDDAKPAEASMSLRPAAVSAPVGLDVRAENAKPGTPGWRIDRTRGTAPGLAGWTGGQLSTASGTPFTVHVSGSGPAQVRALRIGWYGGVGARQVAAATVTGSARVSTANWPPGHYLLRLDRGAASRYVPITVRSPQARGDLLVVTSPLDWAASEATGADGTLDRAYDRGFGAGGFLTGDLAMVQLAERDGTNLAFATDADLATSPDLLAGATGVVFGTSRYWTPDLRRTVLAAEKAGVNAAFLGAGTGKRTVSLNLAQFRIGGTVSSPVLTGLRPACSGAARAWVVGDPSWWGYRGSALSAGAQLPGLVGGAADTAGRAGDRLARSPLSCGTTTQAATYWTTPAGAGVFATGTSRWVCSAGGTCATATGAAAEVDPVTRGTTARVTRVVLQAFAKPRAGATHPAAGR